MRGVGMRMEKRRPGAMHWVARRGWLSGAALAVFAISAGSASAATSGGCAAANRGLLNASVDATEPVSRQVTLDAGDILAFSARSAPGASVSVGLVSGGGAPQTLIADASAAAASFKAP